MQTYTWIYSLVREIPDEQLTVLIRDFEEFLNQWKSHGVPVDGMIQIKRRQFVIIQSNPGDNRPSGCSIDSLKKSVEHILKNRGLDWLENGYVSYLADDNQIEHVHFSKIKERVENEQLKGDTLILDNTLSQTDDLNKWEVPMKESWLKRYL